MGLFREMRRKNQQMSEARCVALLEQGTSGVLALLGDEGYPYALPISYVYHDHALYFHGAKSGHKMDAVRRCSKASFCVVGQDRVIPEKYTTAYLSVIVFGQIRVLQGDEARTVMEKLMLKYYPGDSESNREQEILQSWAATSVFALSIEHMTGKMGKELLSSPCKSGETPVL